LVHLRAARKAYQWVKLASPKVYLRAVYWAAALANKME
jgi:hypothetical protein